jgi:hypothetical protein
MKWRKLLEQLVEVIVALWLFDVIFKPLSRSADERMTCKEEYRDPANTEIIGHMTVIECEGRIVRSEDAFKLHKGGHIARKLSHRRAGLDGSEYCRRWWSRHVVLPAELGERTRRSTQGVQPHVLREKQAGVHQLRSEI